MSVRTPEPLITLDPSTLDASTMYKLMIGAVVPRPIAFVSTQGKDGSVNLAPFSYFNAVSTRPPCVMVSISPQSDGTPKDTLRNIEETGELVVNFAAAWLADPLNRASENFPYGVSEFAQVGLTPLPSVKVKPPRVKESPLQLECVRETIVRLGDPGDPFSCSLVIGRIVQLHIWQDALGERHHIDPLKLEPLYRLGGPNYGVVKEMFALSRPRRPS